jgi:hypothetical protein
MQFALPRTSKRVAITFAFHTMNLFQALDLVFFSRLKKLEPNAVGKFADRAVNAQITQLLQASGQAATSATIRGSFRKAGMDLHVTTLPFRIRIVEQRLRENVGFKEVWD